jgi:type I restriction enzyme S subunit
MKNGWKTVRLGDVCEVIPGFAFKSGDFGESGIPVVKIKNITADCRVDLNDVDMLPEELVTEKLEKFMLSDGDILVAMTGATAGKVGKLRANGPVLLNQRVAKIKPVKAHHGFIWSVVSSAQYQERFYKLADGAAQPNMSGPQIESVELLLPSAPVQAKIASILSAYDDLIENNTRRIKILEQMAQAIYREWFVEFRAPGVELRKATAEEQKLTGRDTFPKGWETKSFGEVSVNFDSKRKPISSLERAGMKGEYPYFGAAKVLDYVNDFIFDGKYLLVAEDGSVITPNGRPVLQMVNCKFWPNNHTHVIQGKSPVSTEFLFLRLCDLDISGYITGAAQPKITQSNLNRIPVVVADADKQQEFNKIVGIYIDLIHTLERKNINLRCTRDLLLPKLISGEVGLDGLEIAL